MLTNLKNITEETALALIVGSTVVSVETFPADDLAATIVRYSSEVVWLKFTRDSKFINKWYVPNNLLSSPFLPAPTTVI